MQELNPYAVILHDPHLRNGLIRDAERSRAARHSSSRRLSARVWLAHALRGLAARSTSFSTWAHSRPSDLRRRQGQKGTVA
jgi:hypothetical protein